MKSHVVAQSSVCLAEAANILGLDKVLTVEQSAKVRNRPIPEGAPILYSAEDLRECAWQNKHAKTDWRLVYVFGFSIRDIIRQLDNVRKVYPIDGQYDAALMVRSLIYLCSEPHKKELLSGNARWVNQRTGPGYYLVDFNVRCMRNIDDDSDWSSFGASKVRAEIKKLGPGFGGAHEALVSEACLSFYQATKIRLLRRYWHVGVNANSEKLPVIVGSFGLNFNIDTLPNECDQYGICIIKKRLS